MKRLIVDLYSRGILVDPSTDLSPLAGKEDGFLSWCIGNCVRVVTNSVVKAFILEKTAVESRNIEIVDYTPKINIKGDAEDWVNYFTSRYHKLKQIIVQNLGQHTQIACIRDSPCEQVSIVGLIYEQRTTPRGHVIWTVEDMSGSTRVVITKESRAFKMCSSVLQDAVVGITGAVSRNGDCIFAQDVKLPDVPADTPWPDGCRGKVVIMSDTQIGSKYALLDALGAAVKEIKDMDGLRAVIHLGDLVDHRGVYPGQEEELTVKSISEQYKIAAEYLSMLPTVPVILVPGNHSLGGAGNKIPSPALPKTDETLPIYELGNVVPVSDPAEIVFDGKVRFLLTHGLSIHSILSSYGIPPTPEGAILAVRAMLSHRHICPPYGTREAQITPCGEDFLVIQNIPNLVAAGHLHMCATGEYRGIRIAVAGSFQSETPYMTAQGLKASPPSYIVVDMEEGEVEHVFV